MTGKQSSLNFVGDFDLDDNDKGFFVSGSVMNIDCQEIALYSGSTKISIVTGGSGISSCDSPYLQPQY